MTDDVENNAQEAPAEKLFTQDELNQVVGRRAMEAKERARRELEAEYQKKMEQSQAGMAAVSPEQQQQPAQPGQAQDTDAMYQQFMERMNQERMADEQRRNQEAIQNEVQLAAQNYLGHMEKGGQKYADFNEVTKAYDPTAFPELTFLLSRIDNADEMVYDLSKNEDKLVEMALLAKQYPQLAQSRLQRLSQSINQNQEAVAEARDNQAPAPLDRMSPSQISGNSDKMSVRDLKRAPWLRG